MEIFHQRFKDTPDFIDIILLPIFQTFSCKYGCFGCRSKRMQLNQRDVVLYVGSFNVKSPCVYTSVFGFTKH